MHFFDDGVVVSCEDLSEGERSVFTFRFASLECRLRIGSPNLLEVPGRLITEVKLGTSAAKVLRRLKEVAIVDEGA